MLWQPELSSTCETTLIFQFQLINFRIDFDDDVKAMLPETMLDMKRALFEVPYWRDEVADYSDLGWTSDFAVDSVTNMRLRKSDLLNFAVFNEGNLYNSLFFKVDELYKTDCEEGGEFCQFHKDVMAVIREVEREDWFTDLSTYLMEEDDTDDNTDNVEYVYNEETDTYDRKPPTFLRVEKLWSVFYEIMAEMDFFTKLTPDTPSIDTFITELRNFDIASHYDIEVVRKKREATSTTSTSSTTTSSTTSSSTTSSSTTSSSTTSSSTTISSTDSEEETTLDPVVEAQEFYSSTFESLNRLTLLLRNIFNNSSSSSVRKKRSTYDSLTDEEKERCDFIYSLSYDISNLRDGATFSLAKISVAMITTVEELDFMENSLTTSDIEMCELIQSEVDQLNIQTANIEHYLRIKEYEDDLGDRLDSGCLVTEQTSQSTCTCECHKKDKLATHNLFASLQLLDNFSYERGGDMYSWYYADQFERFSSQIVNEPRTPTNISKEIIDFEKTVMRDISGVETDFGLSEFISMMSHPAWVWRKELEFPRLYSWSQEAKDEIFKLFNYDSTLIFRGLLKLEEPNFENFSLPLACKEQDSKLKNYCNMLEKLPDLETTMNLMHLAKFPVKIKDSISKNFNQFKPSKKSLPRLSLIPTCFFGQEASKYWRTEDYGWKDAYNNLFPEEFENNLMKEHDLTEPDIYRYPSCKMFSPYPSDNGICQTFNGMDLQNVLKKTAWRDTFMDAFGVDNVGEPLKSEGIDMEDGFIFSLDTMQSMLLTMKERDYEQENLNRFWIKVHMQGEIPWMKKDKSTWKKIEASTSDMSTKFITLKGEKISHKGKFRDIPQKLRKCYFPDEGGLELFDYYTQSNCLLECSWRRAEAVCGCRPWYVPAVDGAEVCFVLGNLCFDQIMTKIDDGLIDVECECEKDCVTQRYTMSLRDKTVLERTSTSVYRDTWYGRDYLSVGTDKMDGSEFDDTDWYNMGEYLKDLNYTLMPQEPLLDLKFPRPIMERGHCGGIWESLESSWDKEVKDQLRDCNSEKSENEDFPSPFARRSSKVVSNILLVLKNIILL